MSVEFFTDGAVALDKTVGVAAATVEGIGCQAVI